MGTKKKTYLDAAPDTLCYPLACDRSVRQIIKSTEICVFSGSLKITFENTTYYLLNIADITDRLIFEMVFIIISP